MIRRSLFVLFVATSACVTQAFRFGPSRGVRLPDRNCMTLPIKRLRNVRLCAASLKLDSPTREEGPSKKIHSGDIIPRFLFTLRDIIVAIVYAIFSHKPIHYRIKTFFEDTWANFKSELEVRLNPVAQHFSPLRHISADGDDRYIRAYDLAMQRQRAAESSGASSFLKNGAARASGFVGDSVGDDATAIQSPADFEDELDLFYGRMDSGDDSADNQNDSAPKARAVFGLGTTSTSSSSGKQISPRKLVRLHMVKGSSSLPESEGTDQQSDSTSDGSLRGGGLPIGRFLKEKWLELLPPEMSLRKLATGKYDRWIEEGREMEQEMEEVETQAKRSKSFWSVAKVGVENNFRSLFDGVNGPKTQEKKQEKKQEKTQKISSAEGTKNRGTDTMSAAAVAAAVPRLQSLTGTQKASLSNEEALQSTDRDSFDRENAIAASGSSFSDRLAYANDADADDVVVSTEEEEREQDVSRQEGGPTNTEEEPTWSDFKSSDDFDLKSAEMIAKSAVSSTSIVLPKVPSLSDIGASSKSTATEYDDDEEPASGIMSAPIPSLAKPENDASVETARAQLAALGQAKNAEEVLLAAAARVRQQEEDRLAEVARAKVEDEATLAELARKRKERERELAAIAKKKLLEEKLQTATEAAAARRRAKRSKRATGDDDKDPKKFGRRDRSKKLTPEEEEEEANNIASMVAEIARLQAKCLMKTAVKAVLEAGNEGAMLTGQDPEELRKERRKKRKERKMAAAVAAAEAAGTSHIGDADDFYDDEDDDGDDEVDAAMEEIEETLNNLSKDAFACFAKHVSDRV